MFAKNATVLVIVPHIDDGEMACGGTIHKLSQMGHQIYYVAFSSCSESLPKEFPSDTLVHEAKQATSILRIASEKLIIQDFSVRHLSEIRQDILKYLVMLKKDLSPSVISLHQLMIFIKSMRLLLMKPFEHSKTVQF